jgi:flavin-dependent dehydrogenase
MHPTYDAVIAGGGLAGLTLARQLQIEAPHIRVLVLEKRLHPVREAAFKVGESSVEIGAHYFRSILGLEPVLRAQHLEKLGLRYFFPHGTNDDITRRTELGPPFFPPVPSFQLDRGRLENWLLASLRDSGVEVIDDCAVKRIDLNRGGHTVEYAGPGGAGTVQARWLVDASGRSGLIRRQLGLTRTVTHGANAAWFRVKARVKVDDWSNDPAWKARVPTGERWLSTNHLMGKGYWTWLIPLGSGSTSIGIVADNDLHPYSRISRYERAMDWLHEFEPQCAGAIEALEPGALEDFLALKHYAHGCERVFSPDGWSLVGEAGVFTDPFYSPGSDFIAIGNDLTADLIVRAAAGENVTARAEAFNLGYLRLYEAFLRLYDGQYRLMGNAQVMTAKAAWDNACYWAISALLYFQRRYRDPAFMASIEPLMRRFFVLHARMQQLFRAWDLADPSQYADGFTNVTFMESLFRLQAALGGPRLEDDQLRRTLDANFLFLERFAQAWQAQAGVTDPVLARFVPPAAGDLMDISALTFRPVEAVHSLR